ncbi:MAG TPA: hypothetical protein VGL02_28440, partial [Streptomyces sp.]
ARPRPPQEAPMRAHTLEPQDHEEHQDQQPDVPLNRRERRAAARGGAVPSGRVQTKAGQKLPPPPVRHRDYAARKRG